MGELHAEKEKNRQLDMDLNDKKQELARKSMIRDESSSLKNEVQKVMGELHAEKEKNRKLTDDLDKSRKEVNQLSVIRHESSSLKNEV